MRDKIEDLRGSEGLLNDDALAVAVSLLNQFGSPAIRISAMTEPGKAGLYFFIGDTIQFDSTLLRQEGVPDVNDNDRWVLVEVGVRTLGNLPFFHFTALRGTYRETSSDWWRGLLGQ